MRRRGCSAAWIPDFEPSGDPDGLAPARRALRAALLRGRRAARQHGGRPAARRPDPVAPRARAARDVRRPGGLALSNAQQRERLAEQVRLGRRSRRSPRPAAQPGWTRSWPRRARRCRGLDATQVWIRCYPDEDRANGVAVGAPRPGLPGPGPASLRADLSALWPSADPVQLARRRRGLRPAADEPARAAGDDGSVGAASMAVVPVGVALELLGYIVIGFPGTPRAAQARRARRDRRDRPRARPQRAQRPAPRDRAAARVASCRSSTATRAS